MSGASLGTDTTVGGWRRVDEKTVRNTEMQRGHARKLFRLVRCGPGSRRTMGVGWGRGLGNPSTALKG